MLPSIFYKEWIKTRRIVWLCLLISLGFVLYAQLRIGRAIELNGAAHLWLVILMKDVVFIDILSYVPLAIGILIALIQYVPEIHQKRLKLTLHLPVNQQKILWNMAIFGICCLLIIFMINYLWLWLYLQHHFSSEIVGHLLLTSLPWYVAGILGYAFTAWICVEPTWKYRIIHALFAVAFIRLLFLSPYPEAYNDFLWLFAMLAFFFCGFIWLSVTRFKEGRQD